MSFLLHTTLLCAQIFQTYVYFSYDTLIFLSLLKPKACRAAKPIQIKIRKRCHCALCQIFCNRCGQSRDREWPLKTKDVDRCQRDNKKTLKLILKREEEVCKVLLARCCDGDFTPALPTSWQVWTKTSVGGVFTITNGKMFAIIDSKKDLLKSQLYLITLPFAIPNNFATLPLWPWV